MTDRPVLQMAAKPLRVAVLVNLPREAASGGHVKYWERMASAAARDPHGIDLTIYFSGARRSEEIVAPHVRFRYLPVAFSTRNLKFISYVPAHTDLAPFHPRLANELAAYDVIHTTDGFFAFARTAEYIARWNDLPLVTSFHTATPAYAELFARQAIDNLFGTRLGALIARTFHLPSYARLSKEKRLRKHLRRCDAVLAMRPEDIGFIAEVVPPQHIMRMRQGVDKQLFNPAKANRAAVCQDYKIDPDALIALFVGRVDAGKNVPLLIEACAAALAQGVKLHLLLAGMGPLSGEVKRRLGANATLLGHIEPERLAQIYASADCLAIASDIEIGGMIALEALASGCPVLVSRLSGIASLCGDPAAMRMVESGADAWTAALVEAARDRPGMQAMRNAALDYRATALASWDDVLAKDFIPVWRQVLASRRHRAIPRRPLPEAMAVRDGANDTVAQEKIA